MFCKCVILHVTTVYLQAVFDPANNVLRHFCKCFSVKHFLQESRAVARKPLDAAAVPFGLKFVNDIHYKFKTSQASKARLQSSKHTGTKRNLRKMAIQGHSKSRVLESVSGKAIRH